MYLKRQEMGSELIRGLKYKELYLKYKLHIFVKKIKSYDDT